jgi:hypothetical protein
MPGRATSTWPSMVASARPRSPSSGRGNGPAGLPLAPAAPRRTRTTRNGARKSAAQRREVARSGCNAFVDRRAAHPLAPRSARYRSITAGRSPGPASAIAIQRWGWAMKHLDHDPLLSATERQASISSPDYADVEAENPYPARDSPLPPIEARKSASRISTNVRSI